MQFLIKLKLKMHQPLTDFSINRLNLHQQNGGTDNNVNVPCNMTALISSKDHRVIGDSIARSIEVNVGEIKCEANV